MEDGRPPADAVPAQELVVDGALQLRSSHNAALTPDLINRQTGAFLHRFQWLDDAVIGAVPETWNWLEGWCRSPDDGHPDVIHFTRGGPWFDDWKDVEFAELWLAEERALGALVVAS